jgi:hypothetical protein
MAAYLVNEFSMDSTHPNNVDKLLKLPSGKTVKVIQINDFLVVGYQSGLLLQAMFLSILEKWGSPRETVL